MERFVTKKQFRGGLGVDWDNGERSLFNELEKYGHVDVFRGTQSSNYEAYSWQFIRKIEPLQNGLIIFLLVSSLKLFHVIIMKLQAKLSDHCLLLQNFFLNK